MKAQDLESIKIAWKNERGFEDKVLSEAEIEGFLTRKSRDISRLFRKGLFFDILLKGLAGISLTGIMILFKENMNIILFCSLLVLGILWSIRFQWLMIRKIPETESLEPVMKTSLENKVRFYYQKFIKSLYVAALSNCLLVIAGMLYYFYFKYGKIRPFQWDDYLVFSLVIVLSFVIGAVAQIKQHNFQVKQLESCLQEIDEESMSTFTIRNQRNKKLRMILVFLFALICGLLLLANFIFR